MINNLILLTKDRGQQRIKYLVYEFTKANDVRNFRKLVSLVALYVFNRSDKSELSTVSNNVSNASLCSTITEQSLHQLLEALQLTFKAPKAKSSDLV